MELAPPRRAFAAPLAAADRVTTPPPASALALNPAPRLWDVFREQLAAARLALRREAMVAAGLALLLTLLTLMAAMADPGAAAPLTPEDAIPAGAMALLVPMAVWKEEGPRLRGYHHGMPVARSTHAMLRAGAGLVWTLLGVGIYLAWLGALDGGFDGRAPPWQWLAPFVGAAVLYLFGTALTLLASHPWRWVGGAAVAFVALVSMSHVGGLRPLWDTVSYLLSGHMGIQTVLTGDVHDLTIPEWDPYLPVLSTWLKAASLWLAAGVGAFLLAAHRQPES